MLPDDGSNPWATEQRKAWLAFAGSTITRWVGMDENVGDEEGELEFLGNDSPFRVLSPRLRVECRRRTFEITTNLHQGDTGELILRRSDRRPLRRSEWNRDADLSSLPTGRVERLVVRVDAWEREEWDSPALVEVLLTIEGKQLLIVAAEAMWGHDGPEHWWAEEWLYVFTDPAVADDVAWHRGNRSFTEHGLDEWPTIEGTRWGPTTRR